MSVASSRWRTRWGPTVVVAVAIFVASVLPATGPSADALAFGVGADKVVHTLSYALLAGLLATAWAARSPWALAAVGATAAVYGGSIEVVQSTLPTRTFSVGDIAANTVGATLAVCWWWWRGWSRDRADG